MVRNQRSLGGIILLSYRRFLSKPIPLKNKLQRNKIKKYINIYENDTGRTFTEITFKGPIDRQLKQILDFFKSHILKEKVSKSKTKAQSNRSYNYPFEAFEEVTSNAFYHRSYELDNPIEINIWPDKIEVLSFPWPTATGYTSHVKTTANYCQELPKPENRRFFKRIGTYRRSCNRLPNHL